MCALFAVVAAAALTGDSFGQPPASPPPFPMTVEIPHSSINNPQPVPTVPPVDVDATHPSHAIPSSIEAPNTPALQTDNAVPAVSEPPAFASENVWHRWTIQADAVYLRPYWQDLELGIPNQQNLGVPNGPIERLDFDPAFGFKIRVQKLRNANSGFRVENTFLSVYSHGNAYRRPEGSLVPTLTHPLGLRDVDMGLGTGRYWSNVLDLMWIKKISCSDCFDTWFEVGPRAAWMDRGFVVNYFGGDALPNAFVDHQLDFRGYGICGGLSGEWHLGAGWSVVAGGRLALLASRRQTSVFETSMRGAALLADVTYVHNQLTPMLDMHASLCKVFGNWNFALGYQMQQWFAASELLTFNDDVHVGSFDRRTSDFGLDGFFLRLGVSF